MEGSKRKVGVGPIGDVPWGTHFCQLYQTREDLIEILVPYFKAGLENNEFCMWITSEPLQAEEAAEAFRQAVPDLDRYLESGQLEILSYAEWYLQGDAFSVDRVLNGWVDKLNQARARGFEGLRLSGNTLWLEESNWQEFTDYEEAISQAIGKYPMMALCTYSLDRCGASEVLDVVKNHQFALIKRGGEWELIESSDRKQAQEALRESETRYRSLFENMPDGLAYHRIVLDGSGRPVDYVFLEVNAAFERLTGLRREDILGKRATEVLPGIENSSFDWIGTYGRVALTGEGARFEQYSEILGRWYSVSAHSPARGYFVAVFEDITERKRAVEELAAEKERLAVTLRSIGDGVITTDTEGRVILLNRVAETLTGWGQEEAAGRPLSEVFPIINEQTRERCDDPARRVLEAGDAVALENHTALIGRDGTERAIADSAAPIRDADGRVLGVVLVFRDVSETRKTEEQLRKLSQAVEQSPSTVIITDTRGSIEYANPKFTQLTGYTLEEAIGQNPRILKSGETPPEEYRRLWSAIKSGGEWRGEFRNRKKNGELYWESASISPVRDPEGKITHFVAVKEDITERRRVEEERERLLVQVEQEQRRTAELARALERERDILQVIMENTRAHLAYLDRNLNLVRVNSAYLAGCGHSEAELLGHNHFELFPNAENQAIFERARDTGQAVEFHAKAFEYANQPCRGITYWDWTLSPVKDAGGHVEGLVFSLVDVTERVRAEQSQRFLAEASKALSGSLDLETTLQSIARLAVPTLGDGCFVDMVEEDGAIRRVAVAHVDRAKEELLRTASDRYPPDPKRPHPTFQVLRTGQPEINTEVTGHLLEAIAQDAEHLQILRDLEAKSSLSMPLMVRERILGVVTFLAGKSSHPYDHTDLPLARELARRAGVAVENARLYRQAQEAVRLRDEFLSVASHELKTPVTSLRGFAQLLARQIDKDGVPDMARLRRSLQIVDQQSEKLSRLVSQLLDVSRIEAGRLALERLDTDLAALVEGVVDAARASTSRHTISVRAPSTLPALVDPLRLEQVLTNLLDNAIKYSPDGGAIEVELEQPNPETVRLAVRDHGIGIPPEHRGHIFDRFYQAHGASRFGGMGLGLHISRQIVSLHGGDLWAEFPSDGGTRFVLSLPTGVDAERAVQAGSPERTGANNRLRR